MKKNSLKGYTILGILFILVSVVAFAVPLIKTATFWISYAFTVIAFAAQIIIWKTAFGREESLKSKFLGLPVVCIGVTYLVTQIISLAVFLFIPTLPIWTAAIACITIACISAVCMIVSDVGRGEIERVSAKTQEKTFYIKQLQTDVELLANTETDIATKSALMQLTEKIRYSDPVSDGQIENIDGRITEKIAELKSSVDKVEIIKELNSLLDERNKKVKLLK